MDARQNSDVTVYDADGNIIRIIKTRKRVSRKQNALDRKKSLHRFNEIKKAGK